MYVHMHARMHTHTHTHTHTQVDYVSSQSIKFDIQLYRWDLSL